MIPEKVDSLSHHLLGRKCCKRFKLVLKQMAAPVAKSLQQAVAAGLFICQVLSSLLSIAAHSCSAESKRSHSAASLAGTVNVMPATGLPKYVLHNYVTHITLVMFITVECRVKLPALEELHFQVHLCCESFECSHCLHFG